MILSIFLPHEEFTIVSNLGNNKIKKILQENVEPYQQRIFGLFNPYPNNHKKFAGIIKFKSNEFQINRIIHYKNGALPIITGEIEDKRINIKMRVDSLQVKVLYLLFGLPIFLAITQPERAGAYLFIISCFYILMMGGFKIESKIQRKFLLRIFKGKLVIK